LGARAVLVARPWCYGLGLAGEQGVVEVISNLLADFDLTLALSGVTSVQDLSREMLVPAGLRNH